VLCDNVRHSSIKELVTPETADANHVRKHVLENYNSALTFASLGAQLTEHKGLQNSRLDLSPNRFPCYGQLCILDNTQTERMSCPQNENCDQRLMLLLQNVVIQSSPYVQYCKTWATSWRPRKLLQSRMVDKYVQFDW